MQCNPPYFVTGLPTSAQFFPCSPQPQPQNASCPDVLGECEITAALQPDGSIHYYFFPTSKWTSFMQNGTFNGSNPLWDPTIGAWFIKRASVAPVCPPCPCQQTMSCGAPRCYYNNSFSNFAPNFPRPQLKFHYDSTTSTSDLRYFCPEQTNPLTVTKSCGGIKITDSKKCPTCKRRTKMVLGRKPTSDKQSSGDSNDSCTCDSRSSSADSIDSHCEPCNKDSKYDSDLDDCWKHKLAYKKCLLEKKRREMEKRKMEKEQSKREKQHRKAKEAERKKRENKTRYEERERKKMEKRARREKERKQKMMLKELSATSLNNSSDCSDDKMSVDYSSDECYNQLSRKWNDIFEKRENEKKDYKKRCHCRPIKL